MSNELLNEVDVRKNTTLSNEQTQRIATALHIMLCKEDHQKSCDWYNESQQAECWTMPSHLKWINRAEGVLILSDIKPEDVEKLLKELAHVISSIKSLTYRYYQLEDFISVMIKESCLVSSS